MIKALGLFSGGLDSMLAIKVLQEQKIGVTAISFVTPFFNAENAERAARQLKIPVIVKDITREHLKMLLKPRHGYGSYMNPCIDCHALMLKIAGRIMEEKGFDFIFTGEVLGERPMSQNKAALRIVARESGYMDYVLRPLSAKLLQKVKPEREGKVDRSKLFDIAGRQRKRQFEMAEKYNLSDVPTPASGCLLTDPGFSGRLRDLLKNEKMPHLLDIELLKVGRHVRLDDDNKIIIGRNERDNELLDKIKTDRLTLFAPRGVRGPCCILPRKLAGELLDRAMNICASYCDAQEGDEVIFYSRNPADKKNVKTVYSKLNRPKEFIGTQRKG